MYIRLLILCCSIVGISGYEQLSKFNTTGQDWMNLLNHFLDISSQFQGIRANDLNLLPRANKTKNEFLKKNVYPCYENVLKTIRHYSNDGKNTLYCSDAARSSISNISRFIEDKFNDCLNKSRRFYYIDDLSNDIETAIKTCEKTAEEIKNYVRECSLEVSLERCGVNEIHKVWQRLQKVMGNLVTIKQKTRPSMDHALNATRICLEIQNPTVKFMLSNLDFQTQKCVKKTGQLHSIDRVVYYIHKAWQFVTDNCQKFIHSILPWY